MQINTTKNGERLKLTKRERDLLVNAGALCLQIQKHAHDEASEHAEAAAAWLGKTLEAIELPTSVLK